MGKVKKLLSVKTEKTLQVDQVPFEFRDPFILGALKFFFY